MNVTVDQLAQVCTARTPTALAAVLDDLNRAFDEAGCVTHLRAAMMLAQVAHESGEFRYTREIWVPTPAQLKYEGRADLGNTQPGDGFFYRGVGWIQVTGRANLTRAAKDTGLDLVNHPELGTTISGAATVTAWFWKQDPRLNDAGDMGNVITATRIVNGGTNGLQQRTIYYNRAIVALSGSHQ